MDVFSDCVDVCGPVLVGGGCVLVESIGDGNTSLRLADQLRCTAFHVQFEHPGALCVPGFTCDFGLT